MKECITCHPFKEQIIDLSLLTYEANDGTMYKSQTSLDPWDQASNLR